LNIWIIIVAFSIATYSYMPSRSSSLSSVVNVKNVTHSNVSNSKSLMITTIITCQTLKTYQAECSEATGTINCNQYEREVV